MTTTSGTTSETEGKKNLTTYMIFRKFDGTTWKVLGEQDGSSADHAIMSLVRNHDLSDDMTLAAVPLSRWTVKKVRISKEVRISLDEAMETSEDEWDDPARDDDDPPLVDADEVA